MRYFPTVCPRKNICGDEYTLRVRPRFHVPGLTSTAERVELPEDEAEHLTRVLRLGVGDEVDVFDGRGGLWRAEIVQAGKKSATNPNIKFRLKFLFLVERADDLIRIQDLDPLDGLDVTRRDLPLFAYIDAHCTRFMINRPEFYLLKIQDNIGDVLDDTGKGGELMLRTGNAHSSDGGSFKGRKKDPTQRVANGMAVTCFEGFSDELSVGFGGDGLVSREALRHFKTS